MSFFVDLIAWLRSPLEDLGRQVRALVRLSLSNCVEGYSYWQYERQAAGWALGYEQLTGKIPLLRLGTRKFAMEVEFLAARIMELRGVKQPTTITGRVVAARCCSVVVDQ